MNQPPTGPAGAPDTVMRVMRASDIPAIRALSAAVYPGSLSWSERQLESHLRVFPEGQLVAVTAGGGDLVGMAASLIVLWDDYTLEDSWRDFTDSGMFTNHDPARGHTLYGAEVMVHPEWQGRGVGKALYAGRRTLAQQLGLLRIRAGARLRDYHRHAARLTHEAYVAAVVRGDLHDRTLSFQLSQGFQVIGAVAGYLSHDPESLGFAAVIEWVNPVVAARFGYAPPAWPDPRPRSHRGTRPDSSRP